jgi:hypothetical protein
MARSLMRFWRFLLAPFVDEWAGLSMTRILALGGFAVAARAIFLEKPVPQGALWLYLGAVAAAFGKSTFTLLLSRAQLTATVSETTTRQITERRDASDVPGTEPTP